MRITLDERRLRVAVATGNGKRGDTVLVDGVLCGSIRPPGDLDDIDWEMTDLAVDFGAKGCEVPSVSKLSEGLARTVCVTMCKEPMGLGVIHWWKTIIKGDAEIDVAVIPDRRSASLSSSSTDRTRTLQDSWRIAHEQFKDNCKRRKKVTIDF